MPFSTRRLLALPAGVLAALALAPAVRADAPPIKPGLWEIRIEREGGAAQPGERLKNLSPERRARIEAMMKEKGLAIGPGGTDRACLDKETLDPSHWQVRSSCKTEYGARSASAWKWRTVCSQPESVTTGEAAFANAENYTVTTTSKMTLRGQERTTHRVVTAKWLGADCGGLKPLDLKRSIDPKR